jgi:hypothetical protein
MKHEEEIEAPEGYDVLRLLVGYDDGVIACCEADCSWTPVYGEGPDFESPPEHYLFFVETRRTVKAKIPIHTFFLGGGKITPAKQPPKEEEEKPE